MSHVVLSVEDRADLWRRLRFYEDSYGYPSVERHKAFGGYSEDFENWSEAWVAWKLATQSEWVPEIIDTHDLETLAMMQKMAPDAA